MDRPAAPRFAPESVMLKALHAFLEERAFDEKDYDRRIAWFPIPYTRWHYPVPNTPGRRWAVRRHDLHHLVTGYNTDWLGECEISAWECGAGLGRRLPPWLVCTTMFIVGMLRYPRRTWKAFRRGRASARSLLGEDVTYEQLLGMTVGEAREYCGLPQANRL